MPVPVPTRCPSHPANKPLPSASTLAAKQSALHHLLSSLPEPPSGPPPAFANRETWIQSLPPSRRYKVREDPAMIPTHTRGTSIDGTQTLSHAEKTSAHAPLSNGKPWPPSPPSPPGGVFKQGHERRRSAIVSRRRTDAEAEEWTEDEEFFAGPGLNRPAPITRRISSDGDVPISVTQYLTSGGAAPGMPERHLPPYAQPRSINHDYQEGWHPPRNSTERHQPAPVEQREARKVPSPIPSVSNTNDLMMYRKLVAEPLSDWVAVYIWKVVTQGMSLPPEFVAHENGYGSMSRTYPPEPPKYLAENIRTLLCATLLQPSAIFLALWYIARFPVFFGVFKFDPKLQRKEYMFRLELIGEGSDEPGSERMRHLLEAHAPFRLILLGVMLANKWLDDNTFSNKTWHQVSGVPIRALNKLEGLGLDLLSHDLSLPSEAWAQWLEHVYSYHRSLTPFPEPIGPPKQNPHVIIRRSIEELIEAGSPPMTTGVIPEPIFLGLAEHKRERERIAKEQIDILDVDLDEDGPLREEYLPKKHVLKRLERRSLEQTLKDHLPPPAAWSPAADPPIPRPRPVYQAVQGPQVTMPLVQQNVPVEQHFYLAHTRGPFPGTIGSPYQRQVPTHGHGVSWDTPQHRMVPLSCTQPTQVGIIGYAVPDMQPQYVPALAYPAPQVPHGYRPHDLSSVTGLMPTTWLRT